MARKIADFKQKRKTTDSQAIKEKSVAYKYDADPVETLLRYRSFEIENFRCIKKLAIAPLEQVNLIAGMNNVGKTTLLEAIFLHIGETNPELALRVDGWRGLGPEISSTWRQLFWQFNADVPIKLRATGLKDKKRSLTITTMPADATIIEDVVSKERGAVSRSSGVDIKFEYNDEQKNVRKIIGTPFMVIQGKIVRFELRMHPPMHPGPVTGIFLNSRGRTTNEEDINFFSQMRIKQRDSLLLRAVQLIEPRLEHLEILSPQGTTLIYGHLKGYSDLVPFPLLGDGTRRLASLILAISAAQGGVVLVDEIENGIHHAIMVDMWAVVAEAATQFNTQVFATTHSQECVAAAHEAFLKREQYRFRLHRLDRLNGEIEAATYDHESLEGALSIPLEVRG